MPTNVYGLNDNFDMINGHVIPAMISKFIEAKKKKKKEIRLLGTGKPVREFIHSSDLAHAIFVCLNSSQKKIKKLFKNKLPIINVGSGESLTILKLSRIIAKELEYNGNIVFDKNFPDGTYKKNLNSEKILKLGWKPKIKLSAGISEVIKYKNI